MTCIYPFSNFRFDPFLNSSIKITKRTTGASSSSSGTLSFYSTGTGNENNSIMKQQSASLIEQRQLDSDAIAAVLQSESDKLLASSTNCHAKNTELKGFMNPPFHHQNNNNNNNTNNNGYQGKEIGTAAPLSHINYKIGAKEMTPSFSPQPAQNDLNHLMEVSAACRENAGDKSNSDFVAANPEGRNNNNNSDSQMQFQLPRFSDNFSSFSAVNTYDNCNPLVNSRGHFSPAGNHGQNPNQHQLHHHHHHHHHHHLNNLSAAAAAPINNNGGFIDSGRNQIINTVVKGHVSQLIPSNHPASYKASPAKRTESTSSIKRIRNKNYRDSDDYEYPDVCEEMEAEEDDDDEYEEENQDYGYFEEDDGMVGVVEEYSTKRRDSSSASIESSSATGGVSARPSTFHIMPRRKKNRTANSLAKLDKGHGDANDAEEDCTVCKWRNCNQVFGTMFEMVAHLEREHIGWDEPWTRVTTCRWTGCWRHDTFSDREKLLQHLRVHTGERPYICPICKLSFPGRSTANSHIKRIHRKTFPPIIRYARDQQSCSGSSSSLQPQPFDGNETMGLEALSSISMSMEPAQTQQQLIEDEENNDNEEQEYRQQQKQQQQEEDADEGLQQACVVPLKTKAKGVGRNTDPAAVMGGKRKTAYGSGNNARSMGKRKKLPSDCGGVKASKAKQLQSTVYQSSFDHSPLYHSSLIDYIGNELGQMQKYHHHVTRTLNETINMKNRLQFLQPISSVKVAASGDNSASNSDSSASSNNDQGGFDSISKHEAMLESLHQDALNLSSQIKSYEEFLKEKHRWAEDLCRNREISTEAKE